MDDPSDYGLNNSEALIPDPEVNNCSINRAPSSQDEDEEGDSVVESNREST